MIASKQPAISLLSSEFIFMVFQFLAIIPIMGKLHKGGFFNDRDDRALGLTPSGCTTVFPMVFQSCLQTVP